MEKVRVVGQPYRGHEVGDVLEVSRRDARYLAAIRRVELVPAGEADADRYGEMKKEELVAEAESRGLEVVRADGKDGAPLVADYVDALTADDAA